MPSANVKECVCKALNLSSMQTFVEKCISWLQTSFPPPQCTTSTTKFKFGKLWSEARCHGRAFAHLQITQAYDVLYWSNNLTHVIYFAVGWLGFSALANAWSYVNAFLSVESALVSVTANQIAFIRPTTPACQPPPEQTNVSVTIVEHQLKIISNLRNRSVSCTHRGCLRSNQIYICCGFPGWQTSNLWKINFPEGHLLDCYKQNTKNRFRESIC